MHIGKNIAKIRELLGIKQESLAFKLKISQQTISKIEQTENLQENTVERIAKALGVGSNIFYNYSDQLLISFLQETALRTEIPATIVPDHMPQLDKIIELYERLLLLKEENERLKLVADRNV